MTIKFSQEVPEKDRERFRLENYFCEKLKESGVNFATGVPCGVQKYIIENLSQDVKMTHVIANRESEAVGIAAGAYLAGKKPMVYMQNSGFMTVINDITSLLLCYQIPILFSVSWRGSPGEDAPQHFVNGKITHSIIDTLEIPHFLLGKENIDEIIKKSTDVINDQKKPAVILLTRGGLS